MFGERHDIAGPPAQRLKRDGHDIQSIKQIFAEAALSHPLLEVAMGGGDDPHVDAGSH